MKTARLRELGRKIEESYARAAIRPDEFYRELAASRSPVVKGWSQTVLEEYKLVSAIAYELLADVQGREAAPVGPEAIGAAYGEIASRALEAGEDPESLANCALGSALALYTKAGRSLESIRTHIRETLSDPLVLHRLLTEQEEEDAS